MFPPPCIISFWTCFIKAVGFQQKLLVYHQVNQPISIHFLTFFVNVGKSPTYRWLIVDSSRFSHYSSIYSHQFPYPSFLSIFHDFPIVFPIVFIDLSWVFPVFPCFLPQKNRGNLHGFRTWTVISAVATAAATSPPAPTRGSCAGCGASWGDIKNHHKLGNHIFISYHKLMKP